MLVAGGFTNHGPTGSAELFDPASETWSPTGALRVDAFRHTATLLPNGGVLVTGSDFLDADVEVYNPNKGTWSFAGSLITARFGLTATLLRGGGLLIAGGFPGPLASAELGVRAGQ